MPIEFTDDRARVEVRKLLGLCFLLLTKDKHTFYERLGFQSEREMAMVRR